MLQVKSGQQNKERGESMKTYKIHFATNRKHIGNNRWNPEGYSEEFSSNGRHNLRFGEVHLTVDNQQIVKYLNKKVNNRVGDGEGLAKYFKKRIKKGYSEITAYEEDVTKESSFEGLTSTQTFTALKKTMEKSADVCVYIHGYNVDWNEALSSALALQCMLNKRKRKRDKDIVVFLFSWPSAGSMMPFAAYWSDRHSAAESGPAVGRAILKLNNYFNWLFKRVKDNQDILCKNNIHLLCHSMGNYVLQNALPTIAQNHLNRRFPRLFEHIFMCAPDVDDDVLENDQPLGRLHEFSRLVSVYFNKGDFAMLISDTTKNNPERLGQNGVANEGSIHQKVHQINCSNIVGGFVEHSYYLWGTINNDIMMSIQDLPFESEIRKRVLVKRNSWIMK